MQRSHHFGSLLGLAGVAVWLGTSPPLVRAQVEIHSGDRPTVSAPAKDKGPPRITVTRLQVITPDPGPPDGPAGFARRQRFGFEDAPREGTSLTFALEEAQQLILGLEARDCKITRFRDDKGTDLAPGGMDPAGGGRPVPPQLGQEEGPISAEVDPAGHRATVTVHSPRFPAGGANRLLIEAVLVVRYGRGEKTVEQKDVNLKADKLTVGLSPMVIMSEDGTARGRMQRDTTQVTLFHQSQASPHEIRRIKGPPRDIKKIAFIGPDGAEIPANVSSWGGSGSIDMTTYSLARHVESCTIRLTVPETVETVNMAVSINTGIGFPPFVSRRILPAPEPRPTDTGAAPR